MFGQWMSGFPRLQSGPGFMLSIQTEVSCGHQNPHLSPAKSLFELDAKVCSFLAAPWKAQVIPVFLQD